jgi:hypothetical protein
MMRSVLRFLVVALLSASAVAQVKVTLTTPTPNASVGAPAKIVASAYSPSHVNSMAILVDNTRVFFHWGDTVTAYLWMSTGYHTIQVQGTDDANLTGTQSVRVYAYSSLGSLGNIDSMTGWQNCTASDCAGGQGTSITDSSANVTSPSRDGNSRFFSLGGTGQYSNAYWYKIVGGSSTALNFMYDLYARVDDPTAPQALEFDVNQSFNQKRWVFGTQCNFKGSHKWDVWDGGKGQWVPTSAPCTQWPANSWVHIIWSVQRFGDNVRYLSVSVNGKSYPLNLQLSRQPSWAGSDIDVAVQLDGDANQTPYKVWVDSVKLMAW